MSNLLDGQPSALDRTLRARGGSGALAAPGPLPASPNGQRLSVSVVIAAYNASAHLGTAIQSALVQTHPPFEVIVIDDGSTDATPEIARSFGGSVTYVRQEHRGVSAARNRGLTLASGEYVAILDADDVCDPNRLALQLQALIAFPEGVGCLTGSWWFNDVRRLHETRPDPKIADAPPLAWLVHCPLLPASLLFRRETAHGLEYPVGVSTSEDMIFLTQLRTRGPFCLCSEPLYGYRIWHGQTTRRFTDLDSFRLRLHWARANWRDLNSAASLADVEEALWSNLAEQLEGHYWSRRREPFLRTHRYLRANWPAVLPRPAVFSWRWYPEWLWRAKGWLDLLTGRGK
jgi:glycosyltransferase involved in cell wall biosynthesis